ncbi:MAG TPA: sugar phosphate isomerase/epimerase family protein [Candidatus Omnitrophota bacterium]|nr:sugar phosphate isomerase/epimerase [Candidatus Omnitrophota bacterium]HOX09379.1 sugar phosphate isomerase/epimerase family protein [Candidatus Omnitrophota bacterium]HRZ66645.1 sugar phosphate isomerase/epimerase family protein [Candidatus Omnitrophota bacterium]
MVYNINKKMKLTRENLYFHAPYRMLLSSLGWVADKGINCEIYADGSALDSYSAEEISRINNVFRESGLKKIVHGPFLDLNPGSWDEGIRDLTLKRFSQAFKFCRDIKAGHIVLHSGFDPIFYKDSSHVFLNFCLPIWEKAAAMAADGGITIAVENSIDNDPSVVVSIVREIGRPNFEACFDPGHYYAFAKMSPFDALKWYPDKSIGEIHLSDNKGDFDSHLPLGEGDLDFRGLIREVLKKGREPIITSEPHSKEDIERNLAYLISMDI